MGLRDKAVKKALVDEEQERLNHERLCREAARTRIEQTRISLARLFTDRSIVPVVAEDELLVDDLRFKALGTASLYLILGNCDRCGSDIIRMVRDWDEIGTYLLSFDRGGIPCSECLPEDKTDEYVEMGPLNEIKAEIKCPLFSAGRDELEECLRERCAIWEVTQERCAFWLLGRRVAADFIAEERRVGRS